MNIDKLKIFYRFFSAFLLSTVVFYTIPSWAQSGIPAVKANIDSARVNPKEDPANQKDAIDLLYTLFRKNRFSPGDTVTKKAHKLYLSVVPGVGYAVENGFSIIASVNGSFYSWDGADANLSSINIAPSFTQDKQFFCPIVTNIWTKGNKLDFLGDIRYYVYPSYTYGLGGETTLDDKDKIDYSFFRFYQQALKRIFPDFVAGVGYGLDYHFNIQDLGRADHTETDFARYGFKTQSISSGLLVNLLYDTRRNLNNPVAGGTYANVLYRPHFTFMGSDANWQSLLFDFRKYIAFPANSRNILAFWNFYWLTFGGNPPYLDLPSTSWDTYASSGRGYIQDRYRGRNMLYLESEYRFPLTRNGLLGAVVFGNAQAFSEEWPDHEIKKVLPAYGAGLRFKINKFSNTNLNFDYARGINGGYVFFNLGEVF